VTPGESFVGEGRVLPFRRRSAAVRVRRRNPWLRLAVAFGKAAALFGVPVAVGLWLFSSPTFALSRLEIEGNQRVDAAWLNQALEPFRGENLWTLSLPDVERAVGANPWVASASVEKRLPDRLRLAIVERLPAALLRSDRGLVVLDSGGRLITAWQPEVGGGDLLLVSTGTATEVDLAGALEIAAELQLAAPDWASTLSEVVALSEDEFRLYLGALPFPILVRGGTLAERLPTLRSLLPGLERRYPGLLSVDLRFERRIVFQPLVERL
jgi:cell division protein FtsQ